MNNKGFAITTILYGIMVLFCLLLVSLLGILSSYRKTQELLINEKNGARDILNIENNNSLNDDGGNINDDEKEENINYTLRFNCNNGNSYRDTAEYKAGESVDLSRSCTKSGYTFVGWNTDKSATTGLDEYIMPSNDVTLYAIYKNELAGRT